MSLRGYNRTVRCVNCIYVCTHTDSPGRRLRVADTRRAGLIPKVGHCIGYCVWLANPGHAVIANQLGHGLKKCVVYVSVFPRKWHTQEGPTRVREAWH